MRRNSLPLPLLLAALTLFPGTAPAGPCPPDPGSSTVPRSVVLSPDAFLAFKVTVVGVCGPISGSVVEIRFNTYGDTRACWCASTPGPRPRVFTATANALGVATFQIPGGGCMNPALIPGPDAFAAEVYADGIHLAECGVISPDAYDSSARRATDTPTWDPPGSCEVGLSDVVKATPFISGSVYDFCFDINQDGFVSLADATILSTYFSHATFSCPGDAGP